MVLIVNCESSAMIQQTTPETLKRNRALETAILISQNSSVRELPTTSIKRLILKSNEELPTIPLKKFKISSQEKINVFQ